MRQTSSSVVREPKELQLLSSGFLGMHLHLPSMKQRCTLDRAALDILFASRPCLSASAVLSGLHFSECSRFLCSRYERVPSPAASSSQIPLVEKGRIPNLEDILDIRFGHEALY
ncbi:hypothetical protein FA13DRAFT_1229190 [Coprinellus micaceus]|uniref:Uncharacterized protein n=1 Tax=Coprinellus micaceus TaxID=71717 RepID=A0A4Y7TPL7_COPMI|nr:hypothetical protein FA13DRAFT_1229190 [Coprinellus micaceus]